MTIPVGQKASGENQYTAVFQAACKSKLTFIAGVKLIFHAVCQTLESF